MHALRSEGRETKASSPFFPKILIVLLSGVNFGGVADLALVTFAFGAVASRIDMARN
jgi:hypothetical protein